MRTATLRQSGGSVIVSIPRSALEKLGLNANDPVEIDVDGDRIIIRRRRRGRIGLAARLAMSDTRQPETPEAREWLDAPEVGREWAAEPDGRKP